MYKADLLTVGADIAKKKVIAHHQCSIYLSQQN